MEDLKQGQEDLSQNMKLYINVNCFSDYTDFSKLVK